MSAAEKVRLLRDTQSIKHGKVYYIRYGDNPWSVGTCVKVPSGELGFQTKWGLLQIDTEGLRVLDEVPPPKGS